jgi:hypothetical protein
MNPDVDPVCEVAGERRRPLESLDASLALLDLFTTGAETLSSGASIVVHGVAAASGK